MLNPCPPGFVAVMHRAAAVTGHAVRRFRPRPRIGRHIVRGAMGLAAKGAGIVGGAAAVAYSCVKAAVAVASGLASAWPAVPPGPVGYSAVPVSPGDFVPGAGFAGLPGDIGVGGGVLTGATAAPPSSSGAPPPQNLLNTSPILLTSTQPPALVQVPPLFGSPLPPTPETPSLRPGELPPRVDVPSTEVPPRNVPEPRTLAVMAAGLAALIIARKVTR